MGTRVGLFLILVLLSCLPRLEAEEALDPLDFFNGYEPEGIELTNEILARVGEVPGDEEIEDLRELEYLLVPGLFSDFASDKPRSRFDDLLNLKPQFFEQIKVLEEWELRYELLKIESEAEPLENAKLLREWLQEKEQASVALVTHSKGGIDALEAFILFPELRSKIKFWIPMQAPFLGTPIADMALSNKKWEQPMNWIFERLGGSVEAVVSVSTRFRVPFLDDRYEEIVQIGEDIPILSVAASKPDDKKVWDTRFEPFFRDWMWERGIENDGIVPWKSSVFPESPYIHIRGIDHLWIEGQELRATTSSRDIMKVIFLTAQGLAGSL